FVPPLLQRCVERVIGLMRADRPRLDAELAQEPAGATAPRQGEMSSRAGDADVEQPPLLRNLGVELRLPDRQLLLLDAREEDGSELESLRAVQREQVPAAPFCAGRAETLFELGEEVARRAYAVVERGRELDEPLEVGLSHQLALSELLRRMLQPACVLREPAHASCNRRRLELAQALEQLTGGLASEERRSLERDLRVVECLLERDQAGVRATEDGHLLEGQSVGVQCANALHDERELRIACRKRAKLGLRS